MIVPGRIILVGAMLLAVALLAAMVMPAVTVVVVGVDVVLVVAVGVTGYWLKGVKVVVGHEWPRRVQMDRPVSLVYRVENRGEVRVLVRLRQAWPVGLEAESDVVETYVDGGEVVRVALVATPRMRGTLASGAEAMTEVEIRFPLDVARRRWQVDGPEMVVYPNLKGIADFEKLRRNRAAAQIGIHRTRTLGSGREFDQLRDYVPDDDYREINWKATAHHARPITNMYRTEQSQEIMICIDCGRMMGNPVGTGTAMDKAVDAAIMLAHVANRQGDKVGLVLFRDVVERFIKPVGGLTGVNTLIEALVEARPLGVFPSYAALVQAMRTRQKRRSMVVIFTDLNDPQLASNLAEVLPLISRRHVVVVVSLRDGLLEKMAGGPAEDRRGMFQVLAARELATERAQHALSLVRSGLEVVEADADSLSLKLINTYLKLKARQLL